VRLIGSILAIVLLVVAGGALMLIVMRWFDLNVQDIPWGRTLFWGTVSIIAIVAGIGGIALLHRGSKSK
jgi:hypothetical protein